MAMLRTFRSQIRAKERQVLNAMVDVRACSVADHPHRLGNEYQLRAKSLLRVPENRHLTLSKIFVPERVHQQSVPICIVIRHQMLVGKYGGSE